MRALLLLALLLPGCAGSVLMRCPEVVGEGVYYCPDHVDGAYYKCKKSSEIRRCENVQ